MFLTKCKRRPRVNGLVAITLWQVASFKQLPVMVYIHGGGFLAGGSVEYEPHVLLDHDIVLVVLQYRVGVMGEYIINMFGVGSKVQTGHLLCIKSTSFI